MATGKPASKVVTVRVEGADTPMTVLANLYNNRLNIFRLREYLATHRLELGLVDGKPPDHDDKGYTKEEIHEDEVTITVTKVPGECS